MRPDTKMSPAPPGSFQISWRKKVLSIANVAKYPKGDWKWRLIESYRLEELDPAVLKRILERYEVAYREGSWNYYLDDYAKAREKMEWIAFLPGRFKLKIVASFQAPKNKHDEVISFLYVWLLYVGLSRQEMLSIHFVFSPTWQKCWI